MHLFKHTKPQRACTLVLKMKTKYTHMYKSKFMFLVVLKLLNSGTVLFESHSAPLLLDLNLGDLLNIPSLQFSVYRA